jgi:hypothetical protein
VSRMEKLIEGNRQAARGLLKPNERLLSFVVGWDERTKGQGWLMATTTGLVYYFQTLVAPERLFVPYHRITKVTLLNLLLLIQLRVQWAEGTIRVGGINRACPYREFVALVREKTSSERPE